MIANARLVYGFTVGKDEEGRVIAATNEIADRSGCRVEYHGHQGDTVVSVGTY